MPWVEKYRPKKFEEIKGQDEAIFKIKEFLKNFGKKKIAIILYGPPGTGKTTLVHAAAKEIDSEIFELNASDLRNREKLKEILKPAVEQKSLSKEDKIILVDEVDGISESDWGGLTQLMEIIDSSSYPIMITANDIWDKKFSPLRKKCDLLPLNEISYDIIKSVILDISKKEGLSITDDLITELSIKAKGDLRAAINDLQTLSKLKDYFPIILDERNKETDIFNSLRKIFKEKPSNDMLGIFDSVNMSIDDIILWVEENIPSEYSGEELARAYDLLSKTDLFKGRIYKQQYWRFLVYENIFLSYGIASSKKKPKTGFTSYKRPSRILQIWLNNQKTFKKKSICEKYSKYVHISQRRAMADFPVIKQILKSNFGIQKELKLEDEEMEYLKL
ncbi:replication factor C large subunit [Candidatus Pacearchaeota archaeon]|jgi:replication factor C large subunit|nr:replication factor C large subunit [Candidatus Pacearchaeota archaeon]